MKSAIPLGLVLVGWLAIATAGEVPLNLGKAVHDYYQSQNLG